jgi:hypothetical protein
MSTDTIEHWAPVTGFEELYEVSTHGRVRSYHPRWVKIPRIIGGFPYREDGYLAVKLTKDSVQTKRHVASLVAEAFLGPREPEMQVCHLDGTKDNNHLSNLMWGSAKTNADHRIVHGTNMGFSGENHHLAKLAEADVRYIRSVYVRGSRKFGSRALARKFGVAHPTIRAVMSHAWAHVK